MNTSLMIIYSKRKRTIIMMRKLAKNSPKLKRLSYVNEHYSPYK